MRSVANFAVRRVVRIAPSYWIFTTLMLVVTWLFAKHISSRDISVPQTIASYLFIPYPNSDGVLRPVLAQGWTLNYEMAFYLVAGISLLCAERFRAIFVVFAILSLMLLSIVFPGDNFVAEFFSDSVLLEFLFGVGISMLTGQLVQMKNGLRLLLFFVGVIGLSLSGSLSEYPRALVQGLPAMLMVASTIMVIQTDTRNRFRRLEVLGDASYALYLIHPFVVNATIVAAIKLFQPNALVLFFLCIPLSVFAAVIFYLAIERRLTFGLTALWKANFSRDFHAKSFP